MKKGRLYCALAAYMALIFLLSVIRMPEEAPRFVGADKLEHLAAYSVMGFLWAFSLRVSGRERARRRGSAFIIGLSLMITFSYGAFIEVCQAFIPWRSAEALDALANGAGGLIGAIVHERLPASIREGLLKIGQPGGPP